MRCLSALLLGLCILVIAGRPVADAQFPGPTVSIQSVNSKPQIIASIAPSNCTVATGGNNLCTAMTVTMSPASPVFTASPTGALVVVSQALSGGACTHTSDTSDFGIIPGTLNLNLINPGATAGTDYACIQVSKSGVQTKYKEVTATVTGGGGGIACDIGPNYTGTIPSGASALGFHCAVNFDFSYTSNFTYNGHTYNYGNVATWLDCAITNGNPPLLYNTGYSTGATPCSDFSIVSDSGSNSLEIQWTSADASSNFEGSWLQTAPNGTNSGFGTFPQGVYIDYSWRSTAGTQTAISGGFADILSFFTWSGSGANNNQIEWDWFETGNDGGTASCLHDWGNGGAGIACAGQSWPSNSNFSPNQEAIYHTYGAQATSNGSSQMEFCTYLDGTLISTGNCPKFSPSNSEAYIDRNYYGTGTGDLNSYPPRSPSTTMIMYIKRYTIFACNGWQNAQCNTALP